MKRLALAIGVALASSAVPAAARAQVAVQVHVGLPAAPPLVAVQPGIQVVEDYDEEVFFTGGWYWVRRDGGWYRARGPRAAFVYVPQRRVPVALVRIPPGQYRHWRRDDHHEWKAEHKAWKEHEKAERREWKEARKERRHGHGHHGD